MSNAPMTAILLVGGLGTRLRPVLADLPKSMAPVAGKPFLEYKIEQLRRGGVTDLILATSHLAKSIRDHFTDGKKFGVRIRYTLETTPQGTAGALRDSRALVNQPFFVLNGDTYLDIDYKAMAEAHERLGTMSIVALRHEADASRYGTVEMGDNHRIRRFREKSATSTGLVSAGVYRFKPEVFDFIPPDGPASMEYDVLPRLSMRSQLAAFLSDGYFIDIGLPETLNKFEADIRSGHAR